MIITCSGGTKINSKTIILFSEAKANFRRYTYSEVDDQGFPYDYSSIMHYKDDAFVKRYPLKSIRPKRSNVQIGQRKRLSDGDIREMNKFYGCPS